LSTDTDKEAPLPESEGTPANPAALEPPPSLTGARVRLALAVFAFFAWIGYLAFLALTVSRPTVVSRPQLLSAQLDVVAVIEAKEEGSPDPRVVIDEQLWSVDELVKPTTKSVSVINLPQATGWEGPGRYLLPLVQRGEAYSIAPVALSPGYGGRNDLRIYKVTDDVLRQERAFRGAGR
jgi:hypothetical protein